MTSDDKVEQRKVKIDQKLLDKAKNNFTIHCGYSLCKKWISKKFKSNAIQKEFWTQNKLNLSRRLKIMNRAKEEFIFQKIF